MQQLEECEISQNVELVKREVVISRAFKDSIPILAAFTFLGLSYGFLMSSKGLSIWYSFFLSLFSEAGSAQFVAINLLLEKFDPLTTFLLIFMVNSRHIFYGLSMLGKYKYAGKVKPYLIFGMCDETFSINVSAKFDDSYDNKSKTLYYLLITMFNHSYWVMGTMLGAVAGKYLNINTKGIEFVLCALFLVIFLNQWNDVKDHRSAIIGVVSALISLILLGKDKFVIASLILIVVLITIVKPSGASIMEGEK